MSLNQSSKFIAVTLVIAALSCQLLLPKAPITCCRRESLWGKGDVIKVRNTTGKVLALWFESNGKRVQFSLRPHAIKEFGWMEGFTFGENSTYTIGGEGFAPRTLSKEDEKIDC